MIEPRKPTPPTKAVRAGGRDEAVQVDEFLAEGAFEMAVVPLVADNALNFKAHGC